MDNSTLIQEIDRLRKEKNAVIMAHYYQKPEIQDVADFIGDSLALARKAQKTDADIIVLCGVHFMGETAKIICPDKKVLVPDLTAGCSLADSCRADDLLKWKQAHPDYLVVSYVNTSAAVKALTDVVVTSSNALHIVEQFPKEQKILFGPDRNLGGYINSITGRKMELWNGACHVHEQFSVEHLIALMKQYPNAKVLAHPECRGALVKLADVVGSTKALLDYATESDATEFLVATESGILHEMQKACPQKKFIPVPPEVTESGKTCSCNECNFMRLNTLEKLYICLRDETNEILVDKEVAKKALIPIERMLDMSK
ncbi:MAG: quinolinate synthase NadA [Paludibacter sp.]|nr:quinolinate synthase NadA [Bacteroidales bacterium]MCM1068522.1 quinolinate synthase NadA [Prevotella sp.]MCM1353476.1 quinolinate synthase NadA [Bacteroides sp.]MCM1442637.1 quinolinate synthase NadA [Muribaculum sp.]MCM1481482.1 quinolinate synthase NadA [Paludibacter sp.]